MRFLGLVLFSVLALVGCSSSADTQQSNYLPKGIHFIDSQQPVVGEASIPFKKYRLENGLTLILAPDHSDPLVHVDVTYHVGSGREIEGRTGFAHFFEHMMFQGSKHVADQQHFKLITEAGGSMNGTTNRDRTNYYESVPSNQLEKVLWLESDRMGYLLDAVSQKKFEIQRDTVKNERAQNYDNRPYGLIWEKMARAMYPADHPYSWLTIGYVDDLDLVDVNDLKAFFLRWYGPNNAVLTIGGDINIQQTLQWVNKYFGPIPKGPETQAPEKRPVTLPEDRYITMEDRVQQPMVVVGWPTEYMGAPSDTDLDVLANVLGGGNNSVLYQQLVKTQKAISAGAFQDCGELSCTFYMYAMTDKREPGKLAELRQSLLDALKDTVQNGIPSARLDEIKGMAEADAIFALDSVSGKVSQLASNQTFYGQPDRIQTNLAKLRAATSTSVIAAANKYLVDKPKVTLSVVPKKQSKLQAHKVNYVPAPRVVPPHKHIDDQQLAYRHVPTTFDRSVMPKVNGAITPRVPKLYHQFLDNGLEIMGTESDETPTVLLRLDVPAGERFVARGKEGLAELTAALLDEGTTKHSAEALHAMLDKLGSSISVEANYYSTSIVVSALKENLLPTIDILREMLFHPCFDEADMQRLQKQMVQGVLYQKQKPTWLASQATRQILYGDAIFSRVSDGTEKSISELTLNDVKSFYSKLYTPHGAKLSVVGELKLEDVEDHVAFLADWQGDSAPILAPQILPELNKQTLYVVDKPHAPQSIVRFVRQGLPFDATGELFLSQLANFNLAGNFNSRMNQNLREDKGYTYGLSGYFASTRETGAIVFQAPVRADSTAASITEMIKEMKDYSAKGMTDSELQFMRLAVAQQDALAYETPRQKAGLISGIMAYDLDQDYLQQRTRIVKTVSKNVLNQLANKWFNPNQYQIIVVGDYQALKPELEKLNIPIERLEIRE